MTSNHTWHQASFNHMVTITISLIVCYLLFLFKGYFVASTRTPKEYIFNFGSFKIYKKIPYVTFF